jgi:uncharacterized protein (UPF0303 family)
MAAPALRTPEQQALAAIEADEARLVFRSFSNADGLALGLALLEAARAAGHVLAVDVRRFCGAQVVFHAALDGAAPDLGHWVQRKSRVVERFHRSSWFMSRSLALKGRSLLDAYGLDERDFAPHGGSFPITVAGAGVVGAVTVSGLPQAQDHALVVAVLAAFLAARVGA